MVLKKAYVLEYKVTEKIWTERVKRNEEGESENIGGLNFANAYQVGDVLCEVFPITPTANKEVMDRFAECKENGTPARVIHGDFYIDDDGRVIKVDGTYSQIKKSNWK